MGTQNYGYNLVGDFWGIGHPDPSTQALGVAGFICILVGYGCLFLQLGFWQQSSRMAPAPLDLPPSPIV